MGRTKHTEKYWRERFRQLEAAQHDMSEERIKEIEKQFRCAQRVLEDKITLWYQRFADNNKITMTEARRLLNSKELEELHWNIQDYIEYGRENAINQLWVKQLENASAKVHISRLEALKIHTQQEMETLYKNYSDTMGKHASGVYESTYYRTAFEIQRGTGIGSTIQGIDDKKLNKIVCKPWAVDGKNFSDRIWESKTKLVNQLHESLTRMCITGETPERIIEDFAKKMKVSKGQATNIIMTESAVFTAKAQEDSYQELGIKEFEVIETLDSHTCDTCMDMDKKHFPMSDYIIGVTVPPFHPRCRGCTCPYFEDEFTAEEERAARNEEGKTYYVPADMPYHEWEKTFVSSAALNDTTDKWMQGAKKELFMDERALSVRKKETAVVYSPKGEFMFQKRGSREEVSFTVKEFRKLKNAVITHNHPSGGSFSTGDLVFLMKSGAAELRVITESGTYYMRPPKDWPKEIDTFEKIRYERNKIKEDVIKKYQELYKNGKINKVQRYQMASDEVNRIFAERYGIEYGKEGFED